MQNRRDLGARVSGLSYYWDPVRLTSDVQGWPEEGVDTGRNRYPKPVADGL